MPIKFVKFLDQCATLILLKKVGGGYIFIHRMLLEYFADMTPQSPEAHPESVSAQKQETQLRRIHGRIYVGTPKEMGFEPGEDLAFIGSGDLADSAIKPYFLDQQSPGTSGLAWRLNPQTSYVALAFNPRNTSLRSLHRKFVKVKNGDKEVEALLIDYFLPQLPDLRAMSRKFRRARSSGPDGCL